MKEAKLIQLLTQFITENEFSDIIKNFDISKSYNDLNVKITFDVNKLNSVTETEKKVEKPVERKVPEVKATPAPKDLDVVKEEISVVEPVIEVKVQKEEIPEAKPEPVIEEVSPLTKLKSTGKFHSITADKNGNIVPVESISKKIDNNDSKLSSKDKTLYKEHYFSDEEIRVIKIYLDGKIGPTAASKELGMARAKDFDNMVKRYKRAKNITGPKKRYPGSRGVKITEADLDQIYNDIRRGDTLTALAKDYKVSISTLSLRLKKYVQEHNFDPLFPTAPKNLVKKSVTKVEEPKKTKTIASKTTTKKVVEKTTSKKIVAVVPNNTPSGWQLASDGKFHLIDNGVVVE